MRPLRSKNRRGATMVEFAIAAPVFFLVLLALFEFGWAVVIRHTADNAAYEAARVGIVPGATSADVRAEATRVMRSVGARSFTIALTPSTINEDTQSIAVNVRGRYDANGIFVTRFLGGLSFEAQSKLLTERPREP